MVGGHAEVLKQCLTRSWKGPLHQCGKAAEFQIEEQDKGIEFPTLDHQPHATFTEWCQQLRRVMRIRHQRCGLILQPWTV